MKSLLEHLDSNESILLMYLADELGPQDRAEVEQMLAGDAGLRVQLDRLRAAQYGVELQLDKLDAAHPLPGSEAAGVRQVGRMVRQWQVQRATAPARHPSLASGLRFPYWSYPLAAAAAVTLAFATWWYNLPEPSRLPGDAGSAFVSNDENPAAPELVAPGAGDDEGPSVTQFVSLDPLDEVENELRQLQAVSESMQ